MMLAVACAVLLISPTRALVLDIRQDVPEDHLKGPPRVTAPPLPRPPPTPPVPGQPSTFISVTTNLPAFPPSTTSVSESLPALVSSPSSGNSLVRSTVTSSEGLLTDMPTLSTAFPTATDSPHGAAASSGGSDGIGNNRTLIITLSTVLSVVGLLLIVGALLICWRFRQRRRPFRARGISPIDDDEIATWKIPRNEKVGLSAGDGSAEEAAAPAAGGTVAAVAAAAAGRDGDRGPSHTKHPSTSSVRKPPSVIVYSNAHGQGGYRHSTDDGSPRSFVHDTVLTGSPGKKMSFDKALPQTPIQARAPNARAGLTDESIPGDEPFLPSPKRQPSRLSKFPQGFSPSQRRSHVRTRSSRSSTRSFGDYRYSGGSDLELSSRHSHDYIPRSHNSSHWRVYSSSSIPPRRSFSDESVLSGGLSPRPLLSDHQIGRAIG